MSDAKHTPGPWMVVAGLITDPLHEALMVASAFKKDGPVCSISPLHEIDNEDSANAHLIAAALDMLEALERIDPGPEWLTPEDAHQGDAICEITVGDLRAVRAAIAKAKGGEA